MTRYGGDLEISNSEIQTFMDCRRRWWLAYFRSLRLRVTSPTGALSLGSRVHSALEQGYSSPGRERAMWWQFAEDFWHDLPAAIETGTVEEFYKDVELARIMLEGFVDWAAEEGLDAGWEVLHPERIVRSPPLDFGGQPVVLKGKLDQVIRRERDGTIWMRDWKTTAYKKPVMMAFGPQLKMYILLLQLTEVMAQVTGGQFVFLRKVKRTARAEPPFYMLEPVYVGPQEMASFWKSMTAELRRMVEVQLALEAGGDPLELAPPHPTRDCEWRCPYYAICPMFDDGSRVEALLEAQYVAVDPYEYYNEDPDNQQDTEETKA